MRSQSVPGKYGTSAATDGDPSGRGGIVGDLLNEINDDPTCIFRG